MGHYRITLATARSRYVHRFTMEHVPQWAAEAREDGTYYAPHYRSDAEWYANTTFPGEAGHLGIEGDCFTTGQTWPLGKSLPVPYRKLDLRYRITLEGAGAPEPQWVVRFCGEWVGSAPTEEEAMRMALEFEHKRLP